MENIQNMKKQFDKMKPPKHAKLDELAFDNVKIINEGLVFDHKNWELVGLTVMMNLPVGKEKLLLHNESTNLRHMNVLQIHVRHMHVHLDTCMSSSSFFQVQITHVTVYLFSNKELHIITG